MACYHAVHDHPGGAVAIAAVAGVNMSVLQHKLNPNNATHHLNLKDLQLICELTGDERILQSVCGFYNAAYFRLPSIDGADNASLLETSADLNRELGELMQQVSASLQDGRVNDAEVAAMDKALMELVGVAKTLIEQAKMIGGKK
jgi:hypothetical protein